MAEDKKPAPGPPAGKDLTSKIATAYRNMPPEQRGKPDPEANEIENPDLDQAFDKMVEMFKVRRPERENSVVTFPSPATGRLPKPQREAGEEYECPECGHNNPVENQFCGMCGAAREDVVAAPTAGTQSPEQVSAAAASESGIKHHHHYYHHHHYQNNPYLLLAVVLLLGAIAWMQWQDYKQVSATPGPVPAVKTQPQPQTPTKVQPSPSPAPASPATVPDSSSKPAKKPAVKPSTALPGARPVQQGEPPGPQVRVPKASFPAVSPPMAPYQSLTNQTMPALPSFPSKPSNPATTK